MDQQNSSSKGKGEDASERPKSKPTEPSSSGVANAISQHWDRMTGKKRVRWWNTPSIVQHVNELVCGQRLDRPSAGAVEFAKRKAGGRVFSRGISVGCGTGNKEMTLIQRGLVDHFVLYELSPVRIERGRELAETKGISSRVEFRHGDAFEVEPRAQFDFVHWNSSLHHMFDTRQVVKWSYDALEPGGMFYMDEYVGPSRMQWSDSSLALGTKIRRALPERYRKFPEHPEGQISVEFRRPNPARIIDRDPSEAADSERIIASVREFFPDAEIIYTGGVVYDGALSHAMIPNFDFADERDAAIMRLLMIIDELCIDHPSYENHFAVAVATKQ